MIEELTRIGWVEFFFVKDSSNVHAIMIHDFWSSTIIYNEKIVGWVVGVHIFVSQESIFQVTGCADDGFIYEEGWNASFPYSSLRFVDFFLRITMTCCQKLMIRWLETPPFPLSLLV